MFLLPADGATCLPGLVMLETASTVQPLCIPDGKMTSQHPKLCAAQSISPPQSTLKCCMLPCWTCLTCAVKALGPALAAGVTYQCTLAMLMLSAQHRKCACCGGASGLLCCTQISQVLTPF